MPDGRKNPWRAQTTAPTPVDHSPTDFLVLAWSTAASPEHVNV